MGKVKVLIFFFIGFISAESFSIPWITGDSNSEINDQRITSTGQKPFKCPSNYGFYTHPDDCHKYVVCTEGEPLITECPKNEFYHESLGCIESRICPQNQNEFQQSGSREECLLPPEKGNCEAEIPRYYYDTNTGRCRTFTYSGCEGNNNNFRTLPECEMTCLTVMLQNSQDQSRLCKTANYRFSDSTNCRKFIQCNNYSPKRFICPIGKGYKKIENKCVDIALSDCRSNSVMDIMGDN